MAKGSPIGFEERKRIGVEILREIRRVSQELGVRFYLAYGTLLGAVRHHGYIPWDDDVDIWMFRDDFDRFVSAFNDMCLPDYRLLWLDSSPDYPYLMPKIVATSTHIREKCFRWRDDLGVFVDLFVLNYVHDATAFPTRRLEALEHRRWVSLMGQSVLPTKIKLFFYNLIQRDTRLSDVFRKPEEFTRQIMDICKNGERADLVMSPTSENSMHLFYDTSCWDESLMVPFEDDEFLIPAHYDGILRQLYGDYMKLPPQGQREQSKHIRQAYYRV